MSEEFTMKDMRAEVEHLQTAAYPTNYILCGPIWMLEMELGPLKVDREGRVLKDGHKVGEMLKDDVVDNVWAVINSKDGVAKVYV